MSPEIIKQKVCNVCEVTVEDIEGSSREREVYEARLICIKIIKEQTGKTYKRVGAMIKKNASVVCKAMVAFDDLRQTDNYFRIKYERVRAQI